MNNNMKKMTYQDYIKRKQYLFNIFYKEASCPLLEKKEKERKEEFFKKLIDYKKID